MYNLEKTRILQTRAIVFLAGFLVLFLGIVILFAAYFSPAKSTTTSKEQVRQQEIIKSVTNKDVSFDQLPSISSVSDSAASTDFLYTKEYQLSRLETQYKLADLLGSLDKLGETFTLEKAVGSLEGNPTLVTFKSPSYELTYSLTKGLVGVGYKGSDKLDALVPKLFAGKQVSELESKGYIRIGNTKNGLYYFAHSKFQLGGN